MFVGLAHFQFCHFFVCLAATSAAVGVVFDVVRASNFMYFHHDIFFIFIIIIIIIIIIIVDPPSIVGRLSIIICVIFKKMYTHVLNPSISKKKINVLNK